MVRKKRTKKATEGALLEGAWPDGLGGLDFPCEASTALATDLFEKYGERFVALCKRHGSPLPMSWLNIVAGPTLAGKPPPLRHRNSIKDKRP